MCSQSSTNSNDATIELKPDSTAPDIDVVTPAVPSLSQLAVEDDALIDTPRGTIYYDDVRFMRPSGKKRVFLAYMDADLCLGNFCEATATKIIKQQARLGDRSWPHRPWFLSQNCSALHSSVKLFKCACSPLSKGFFILLQELPSRTNAHNMRFLGWFEATSNREIADEVRAVQRINHI